MFLYMYTYMYVSICVDIYTQADQEIEYEKK